jgi:hypothetical protein
MSSTRGYFSADFLQVLVRGQLGIWPKTVPGLLPCSQGYSCPSASCRPPLTPGPLYTSCIAACKWRISRTALSRWHRGRRGRGQRENHGDPQAGTPTKCMNEAGSYSCYWWLAVPTIFLSLIFLSSNPLAHPAGGGVFCGKEYWGKEDSAPLASIAGGQRGAGKRRQEDGGQENEEGNAASMVPLSPVQTLDIRLTNRICS